MGWLGLGPRVMDRLGFGVWVIVSFQIFASTAGVCLYCPRWSKKLTGLGNMSEGEMCYTAVGLPSRVGNLALYGHSTLDWRCSPFGVAVTQYRARRDAGPPRYMATATTSISDVSKLHAIG